MEYRQIKSKSGNIQRAGYDPATQKMEVHFTNSAYQYSEVTPDEWQAFADTFDNPDTSTGSHFHLHLKTKPYKRLGE